MAENRRIRLEGDIENWLLTQAERVLGKSCNDLTAVDYSTLVNRILYEFKLLTRVQGHALPLGVMPMSGAKEGIVRAVTPTISEDYSFDAQLGDLFEQEAA